MTKSGQIQLILGPMFSGKTTELIKRVKRHEMANYKCMIVKYAKDNRYDQGDCIATHDNNPGRDPALKYDVIGVDEGQFYKDIVEFSEKMANLGKLVIVSALDGTFQRKGFNEILNLIPLSEHIVKLSAVCMVCYGDAAFSKRTTSDTQVELIGGADAYLAVCRNCYHSSSSSRGQVNSSPNKAARQHAQNENVSPQKRLATMANNMQLSDRTNNGGALISPRKFMGASGSVIGSSASEVTASVTASLMV